MNLTDEQKLIVRSSGNLIVEARAGTGKTTTLIEYSKVNFSKKKLYLAFNRSIADEAKIKFKKEKVRNIDIFTAHGLAFKHVINNLQYKLGYNLNHYNLTKFLKIKNNKDDAKTLSHSIKMFDNFCNSNVDSIDNFDYASTLDSDLAKSYFDKNKSIIVRYAKTIWDAIEKKKMDCTHSWYLKYYQLLKIKLPYDIIMLDEAQDANPVILDIFNNQNCTKIAVGDDYQAIYGWRGAVNAIRQLPYPKLYLSESFRFPESISKLALDVLSFKENYDSNFDFSKVRLIGKGSQKEIKTKAIISRSNLALLKEIYFNKEKYKKPYIEGGLDSLIVTNSGISYIDLYYFIKKDMNNVNNSYLKNFKSVEELLKYYEEIDDTSIPQAVELLQELKFDFLSIVDYIKDINVPNANDCDYTFSTIHKAKGKEWDEVSILVHNYDPYFPNGIPSQDKSLRYLTDDEKNYLKNKYNEELNIYYVGVTRAKVRLIHAIDWIKNQSDYETQSVPLSEPVVVPRRVEKPPVDKLLLEKVNSSIEEIFQVTDREKKIMILESMLKELKSEASN